MNKLTALRVVLWMIAIYHLGLGAATFISDDLTTRLAWQIFGLNLDMTPQLSYIVQLLGVYAIAFGIAAIIAARNPLDHRPLLNVIVMLYVLRVANKLMSLGIYAEAFDASMTRVWTDVVLLAAFGGAVLILRRGAAAAPAPA